jgi:hypothetical protein
VFFVTDLEDAFDKLWNDVCDLSIGEEEFKLRLKAFATIPGYENLKCLMRRGTTPRFPLGQYSLRIFTGICQKCQ